MTEPACPTPWDDPCVKDALSDGRAPSDIMLLDCPNCGEANYYNEGSHYSCRFCDRDYACISSDEDPPADRDYIVLGDEYALSDFDSGEEVGP